MNAGRLILLPLLFAFGCSGSKPSTPVAAPAEPQASTAPTEPGPTDEQILRAYSLGKKLQAEINYPLPLADCLEQLEANVKKVDDFLAAYRGTREAGELKVWRTRAGEQLDKWQAEDEKAKQAPVKVTLAALLAECRQNPKSADEKYQKKWLIVVGTAAKVSKVAKVWALTGGELLDGSSNYIRIQEQFTLPSDPTVPAKPPVPPKHDLELEVVVKPVAVKPEDKVESNAGFVCTFATMDGVKEGDTVTILGKWSSRFGKWSQQPYVYLLPYVEQLPYLEHGPSQLIKCALVK